jgi:hypothetical protein
MKRRLLNVSAWLAEALCVGLVALAVRSCWVDEDVRLTIGRSTLHAASMGGEIRLNYAAIREHRLWSYRRFDGPEKALGYWKMMHFDYLWDYSRPQGSPPFRLGMITFPHWVLVLPLACLAVSFHRKGRRRSQVGFAVQPVNGDAESVRQKA